MNFAMIDTGKQGLLGTDTKDQLHQIIAAIPSAHADLADRLQSTIAGRRNEYAAIEDFAEPSAKVDQLFLEWTKSLGADEKRRLKRAFMAKLALGLPEVVKNLSLPESILALYPEASARLSAYLTNLADDAEYGAKEESFRKDVRFVLGLSVPCGARIIDLVSRVSLQSVMLSALRAKNLSVLPKYLRAGGTGQWFRHHVDSRYVSEFTEEGLEKFYLRVADLLERNKSIKGLTGTSWYYDPEVAKVSPRLAYLQLLGERGAFFLRHGTGPSAVANATKTSETRRRLYQEGKYIPTSYSMLWPRKAMLAWAGKTGS
jgi:hypothetical protein